MLIELMISLAIGLLIIGSLVEVYLSNQNGYQFQDTLNHLQDNAKMAADFLKSDIQQSGYIGCAKLSHDFPIDSNGSYSITPQNKLSGSDTTITIRHMTFPNDLLKSMPDASTLYVSKDVNLHTGDILMISDCIHAEIFQAASVSSSSQSQKIMTTAPLHYQYQSYAEVGGFAVNTFYVDKTGRITKDGKPVYALFVKTIDNKTELVEGVNALHFSYSINQDNNIIDQSADEITDWSTVMGVAIDLDMISSNLKKPWHIYVSL